MLPDVIINDILSSREEEEKVNVCRITFVEGKLVITSNIAVAAPLADIVMKDRNKILKEIKEIIPEIMNIQIAPTGGKKHVQCSALSIGIDATHNTYEEIGDACDMTETAHRAILDHLTRDLKLKAISDDMKHFRV